MGELSEEEHEEQAAKVAALRQHWASSVATLGKGGDNMHPLYSSYLLDHPPLPC